MVFPHKLFGKHCFDWVIHLGPDLQHPRIGKEDQAVCVGGLECYHGIYFLSILFRGLAKIRVRIDLAEK